MRKNLLLLLLAILFFAGCLNSSDTAGTAKKELTAQRRTNPNSKIRNGIELDTKDVTVSQAFLMYADGKLVPQTNEITVGTPVKIRLVIDKGWKKERGRVSLGASERIETSDGKVVLDEKDLFSSIGDLPAAAARFISLTATVSGLDKLYDYFLVSFRVWDKKGSSEIKGSYKLYIK